MISKNKYRILIWIIVILLATNLSMIISSQYGKPMGEKVKIQVKEITPQMPAQQRTRFFKEQLNLHPDQMDIFRELNRYFNRTARGITIELETLRIEMVSELGKKKSDGETLDSIAKNIGRLHSELKNETINYYLQMKEVCTEEQQGKLNAIFMAMLRNNEDVSLPKQGRKNKK
jgi:Asp-tRNA(Asn)/Glu-tRNA(Gln) amidotransferase B subunit